MSGEIRQRGSRGEQSQTGASSQRQRDLARNPKDKGRLFLSTKLESNRIKVFCKNHSKLDSGTIAREWLVHPNGRQWWRVETTGAQGLNNHLK